MNDATVPSSPPELVIEAGRAESRYWHDLWRYRELLGFLAWRDIKVRYQQTALGAAWAIVQPLATIAIFTFVFGRLAKMPAGNLPYILVVMAGQLGWQLFANALSGASASLVGSAHLISKVYFPRLVVPLSTLGVALVDFVIVFVLFAATSIWFGILPTWHLLLLPVFIVVVLLLALGAGLWLAALTVKFRDFRIVLPFLLQVGVFVTPVGFRTDFLPNWRQLLSLNPMTGVVDAFRWSLLGDSMEFYWQSFGFSLIWTAVLLFTGIRYFRGTERSFADVI
jgi:lipopolysaccharide transport system permease protein